MVSINLLLYLTNHNDNRSKGNVKLIYLIKYIPVCIKIHLSLTEREEKEIS